MSNPNFSLEKFKEIMGDIFSKGLPPAPPLRTDEEIEAIISRPESYYHKIIPGYWYTNTVRKIHTGRGGAQIMYKAHLKNGATEDEAAMDIWVYSDVGLFPIRVLNVNKKTTTNDNE